MRPLREAIENLKEYMYSGSAYPGPEPGKVFSLNVAYPGAIKSQLGRDEEEEKKRRAFKKKRAKEHKTLLRFLALWQRNHDP